MTTFIAIVDAGAGVPLADRVRAAAALQRQSLEHFAPAWGVGAHIRAATPEAPPAPGEWVAELRASLTGEGGALAVHDVQADGTPVIRVDVGACRQFDCAWESTLGHEVCEALADPSCRIGAQDAAGTWYAFEVCDAVEQGEYAIDGVPMTNFCTPAWFGPVRTGARYDYLGQCAAPFEVRPGGYAQTWDPKRGWAQRGRLSPYRAHVSALGAGRAGKRPRVRGWRARLAVAWARVRWFFLDWD